MKWTPDQIAIARELHAACATEAQCMARLGRSKAACNTKIYNIRSVERVAARVANGQPPLQATIPDEVIADAIRRARAPRTITSWICGDPPPGYSALERRA